MIHLILLSGGSGTRLWPLSNDARSKQFLKVLRDEDGNHVSMVQRVFKQIDSVPAEMDITIATGIDQRSSIESQVDGIYTIVVEPERRDTAPAIMLASANLAWEQNASLEDSVVVMPIDTFADQAYCNKIIERDDAVQADDVSIVLIGVEPTDKAHALAKIFGLKYFEYPNHQYGADYIFVMLINIYEPNDSYHPENSRSVLLRRFHEAKEAEDDSVVGWGESIECADKDFLNKYYQNRMLI